MTLVLDRYFVRRLRVFTGEDGDPLNEVEVYAVSSVGNLQRDVLNLDRSTATH